VKVFVTLPTFNESKNIESLIQEIRRQVPGISIVVADDDSPDGTWRIVEEISKRDPNLFLLRRTTHKGRGSAGVDAFRFALEHQADVIIEMDADFSHDPKYIPLLLERIRECDLVIGSRAVPEGKDQRRSSLRKWITQLSSLYARSMLGLSVRDCNSGYRCFRREVLEAVNLDTILSIGPSLVQELLFKAHLHGFSICEIPIVFIEREAGQSKLNSKRLLLGFLMILRLKVLHLLGSLNMPKDHERV
jgi:dolichol-phosphate mannosyltransferase